MFLGKGKQDIYSNWPYIYESWKVKVKIAEYYEDV